jgi:hypothetical protein
VKGFQAGIGLHLQLVAEQVQRVRPPFHVVENAGSHSLRMQGEPHRADRRTQELLGATWVKPL